MFHLYYCSFVELKMVWLIPWRDLLKTKMLGPVWLHRPNCNLQSQIAIWTKTQFGPQIAIPRILPPTHFYHLLQCSLPPPFLPPLAVLPPISTYYGEGQRRTAKRFPWKLQFHQIVQPNEPLAVTLAKLTNAPKFNITYRHQKLSKNNRCRLIRNVFIRRI